MCFQPVDFVLPPGAGLKAGYGGLVLGLAIVDQVLIFALRLNAVSAAIR
jgi:hypothetical protein